MAVHVWEQSQSDGKIMDLTAEGEGLSVILVIEQEERRSISTREEATTMNEQPEGEQTV